MCGMWCRPCRAERRAWGLFNVGIMCISCLKALSPAPTMKTHAFTSILVLSLLSGLIFGLRSYSYLPLRERCLAADCAFITFEGKHQYTDAHSLSVLRGLLDGTPAALPRCGKGGTLGFWADGALLGEVSFLFSGLEAEPTWVLIEYVEDGVRHTLGSENAEAIALLRGGSPSPCGCGA
jgi:hypothetical protein